MQDESESIINVRLHTGFTKCNLSCPYCIAGHSEDEGSRDLELEDETWDGARFDRIIENLMKLPFRMNIRLRVPGEIFLNKRLVQRAKTLARSPNVRSLNILTNLSLSVDQCKHILSDVDPPKWAFVASFHPTEVKDREKWIEAAVYMNQTFDFSVVLVAFPPLLEQVLTLKGWLEKEGLEVFVQAFIGQYDGKDYPQSYSGEEKRLLRSVFYSRHDYEFFVELKKPGLCNAGHRSFYVDETGKVTPCGMGHYPGLLGDLSNSPVLELNRTPQLCPFTTCRCDTENMNTLVFKRNYIMKGINQHKYKYRFAEQAAANSRLNEWEIDY